MIRPVAFRPNGEIDVWHDEAGHGGVVNIAGVHYPVDPISGEPDTALLAIACPSCPAMSWHPIGGGGAPDAVQALHILKRVRSGARFADAVSVVRAAAVSEGGDARFRHALSTREALENGQPVKERGNRG